MEELNCSVLNGNGVKKGEEDSRVTILNIESLEIEKNFDQRLSFQMSPPKRDTVINLCKVAFQPVSTNHSEQFSKPTCSLANKTTTKSELHKYVHSSSVPRSTNQLRGKEVTTPQERKVVSRTNSVNYSTQKPSARETIAASPSKLPKTPTRSSVYTPSKNPVRTPTNPNNWISCSSLHSQHL